MCVPGFWGKINLADNLGLLQSDVGIHQKKTFVCVLCANVLPGL